MTISGVNKAKNGEIIFNDKNIENQEPHKIVNLGISKFQKEEEFFQD